MNVGPYLSRLSLPSLVDCQLIVVGILILVCINLLANLNMLRRTAPRDVPGARQPMVSVLIPARNEARNIERCVQSILAQRYGPFEVLVLDDGSTDATPEIVSQMVRQDARLRLVTGHALPQGWLGKSYACHQLAQLARGDLLLFIDADTCHQPDTLAWAVAGLEQNEADLVSLIPRTVTHTVGEDILLPLIPFGLLGCFPLALGARLQRPSLAMAVGTFMLFRRECYLSIGGHSAVRNDIAEDVALARSVCRSGGKVALLDGSEHMDVHFYHGFWETWHGLAKSAFAALSYRLLPTMVMLTLYGALFVWPTATVLLGLSFGAVTGTPLRIALFIALLNGGLWYVVARRFRLSRSVAILYPVTVLLTAVIILDSVRRTVFAGVGWKDRMYHLRDGTLWH